jgi:hypothetical protein
LGQLVAGLDFARRRHVTAKKEITGLCASVADSMPRRINAWIANGARSARSEANARRGNFVK